MRPADTPVAVLGAATLEHMLTRGLASDASAALSSLTA